MTEEQKAGGGSPVWLALLAASTFMALVVLSIVSVAQAFGPVPEEGASEAPPAEEGNEKSTTEVSEAFSGPTAQNGCQEQRVIVANTGDFPVAKLRVQPGFAAEQAASISRGEELTVCEMIATPGKNIPNRWFRITSGRYAGLWIHEQVLGFQ